MWFANILQTVRTTSRRSRPLVPLISMAVVPPETPCGFYWTEGNTGLGWAVDAIPTLKGGSAGMYREYLEEEDSLPSVRGTILVDKSEGSRD